MFDKLKTKLSKSIKSRKLNVFGLFFLLSFLFWTLTKLSKSYTETIAFDIVYKNIPQQHHINTDSTKKINITVEAYGFNLLRYSLFQPTFTINFKSDVVKENHTYIWNASQNGQKIASKFKNSVDILSVQPDTLRFPYQSLLIKKVPVRSDISVEYAAGYDVLEGLKIEPDSVKVIGVDKYISQVDYVITQKTELKQINSDIDRYVPIEIDETLQHVKISRSQVRVFGKVEKFTEGTFNVPVTIINMPADTNINFFPKTIPVAYNISLNNYKQVKPSDFKVECDYKDIKNTEKTFLIPKLTKIPKLVKSARLKQKKVEFILLQ